MKIEHISVSRKQTWDTCQQQYLYKYHLERTPLARPIYLTYGSIVHKIAEEYVRAKGERTITSVAAAVMDGEIPLKDGHVPEGGLKGEYAIKLPRHLAAIKKLTDRIGFDGDIEREFSMDIDADPKTGEVRVAKGIIDRLFQRGNTLCILDYKTSRRGWWRKTAATIGGDLQLRFYARAVQKETGAKASEIHAAIFHCEGEELIGTYFSEESLAAAEDELRRAYRAIVATPPEAAVPSVGQHCKRCSFNIHCPHYRP
jgi:ATP-dependent exoDNAse (exonuclease V) beta subunit